MTTRPSLSIAATAAVVTLLIVLLAVGSYIAGYFICSGGEARSGMRIFDSKWQYDIYQPMVKIEEIVTGEKVFATYFLPETADQGWQSYPALQNDPISGEN
jgi:hypothetical protein